MVLLDLQAGVVVTVVVMQNGHGPDETHQRDDNRRVGLRT